jgi:hypothetical protein
MFQFINTLTKLNFNSHEINLLTQYVDYYLISLIDGLRQTSFGLDTLIRTAKSIEKLHKRFPGKKWMIDSGGYSVITGDVSPRDLSKFLDCYIYYLEHYASTNCDYIMSLDIPILLKYPEFNNVKFIKKMNHASLYKSKQILDKDKSLYDKFVFVWQFKTQRQYKLWCEVYDEVFTRENDIKHFAIGGQVGLRGVTGIAFSPFIGSCYHIMNLLYEKDLAYESILHLLGIYGLHDRFLMGIFERLFNYYLKERQGSVKITYDTVNHMISGLYKVRELKSVIIEDNNVIHDYNHLIIDKFPLLIENDNTCKSIQKDLENILNNNRINDTSVIATLEVIKNQIFNQIMDLAIENYKIVDLFLECDNYNIFKNRFTPIYLSLEKDFPYIFGNRLSKVLINFQLVYSFHHWWNNGRDQQQFQVMMGKFIKKINYPFDLAD